MISLLREFTKSWIFTLLMGLLILSFAVFGLKDVFSQVSDNVVIKAGEREMTMGQFRKRFDDYRQRAAEQGQSFSNEEFVEAGLDVQMLDAYSKQLAYSAWLDKLGIKPSARMIVEQISKYPVFFNQVTGKFDKETYKQRLAQEGQTQADFEQEVGDSIAAQQYGNAALVGLKMPRIYSATQAAGYLQSREASFFALSPANVANPSLPTEAEMQAYYKSKSALLQRKEIRQATIVQFSPAMFAGSFKPTDEELRAMYQASLARLVTPETRSYIKVTAPDAGAAAKISAALKAGQDADAAAKANKGTVIVYTSKPKSSEPDTTVANTAFAMQTNEVSDAIKGVLGFAVVKMGEIKAGETPSYESIKPKLVADYQNDKALTKVNTLVTEFQAAHDSGEDFAATAKRMGLATLTLQPMDAEGKTETVDPATGKPADYSNFTVLVKDIFDLTPGGTSDVEEMGRGQYFALRLDKVTPAGLIPLDAGLRQQLTQLYMQEKMGAAVSAKADEIMRRLNSGEDFAKVAADMKTKVEHLPVNRQNAQQLAQQIGNGFVGRVLTAEANKPFQVAASPVAILIGRVDAIHQGDAKMANMMAAQMDTQMAQSISRDIDEMTRTSAVTAVKTKTFVVAADRALQVEPKGSKAGASKSSGDKAKADKSKP